jgi:putative ABC transport system ATP-binding protein
MAEIAPLIRIRDLAYSYPGGPEVLRIPALDVSGRGLIAITGPSGAGKSTFVELLAGTLQSGYQGSVEVLGSEWRDLRHDADRQRHLRRIGFIPQDFGLLPDRTPRQMLQQDLADSGVAPDEHAERIERALSEVGMGNLADQRIASLSGGQGQRVAIARMLARDVELVIADEPTANLDSELRSVVMTLLRKLSAYVPVVVVTHDAAVAEACDRTIILQPAATRLDENVPVHRPRRGRSPVVFLMVAMLLVLGCVGGALLLIHNRSHEKPAHPPAETVGLRLVTISASQSSPKYQVKIPYPQLVSSLQDPRLTRINVVLGTAAQKPVAPFEQTLFDNTGPSLPGDETSMLTGTATTDILNSDFASFTFNISQFYAGAAHPFATIETFNFDERTGRLIQLADLFQPGSDWLSVLSQQCRSLLAAVAAVGPIGTGSGTSPVASNFSAWALTPWGLSIQFQEYQVGPYADGQPTIVIPFSALRSVALAGGPLSSIEASRSLRSPLLPAVDPPVVNECMAPTSYGLAGPTPLSCRSGGLNVNAWNEWNLGDNFSITGLGRGATLKNVERAMCADTKSNPYYSAPYEIRLEEFSATYYGWRFATSPALHFPQYCST